MEKKIISVQIALFYSKPFEGKFEDLSLKLKDILGKDNSTTIFPVPDSAPAELPRLILTFDDFNIHCSKNRMDFFYSEKNVEDFRRKHLEKIYNIITNNFYLSVIRVGYVSNFFVKKGTIETLKSLLKEEISELKEITLRINKRGVFHDYACNNIEQVSLGSVSGKDSKGKEFSDSGIILVRDLNTAIEEGVERNLDATLLQKLLETFEGEGSKCLLLT